MNANTAQAILLALRSDLGAPALHYRTLPDLLQDGGENTIAALELGGSPAGLAGPLILRCYPAHRDPVGVRFEAALHGALREQGFPAPQVHAAVERSGPWGSAFLLVERLPGRVPLQEIGELDRVFASPVSAARTLPRMVREALRAVPDRLAETMGQLHQLDEGPAVAALEKVGIGLHRFTAPGRLERLEVRAREAGLDGLTSALAWLHRHRIAPSRRILCHGDLQFLNLLVESDRTTGVIDWSFEHCTFDDPHFDVGNTIALLSLRLPGLPRALRPLLELAQRRMVRRFRRTYAAHSGCALDEARLRWAEVFRYVREMVAAGELLRRGESTESTRLRHDEPPWLIPELRHWVLAAISARTGTAATLPETTP